MFQYILKVVKLIKISATKLTISKYIAYLLVTWIISSLILTTYSSYLTGLIPVSKFHREFFICGGQILFQAFIICIIDKTNVWAYLINMMTISFLASVALLIFIGFGKLFLLTAPLVYAGFFALIVALMFLFHLKRMNVLQLDLIPSATWVLYRLLVLTIIL